MLCPGTVKHQLDPANSLGMRRWLMALSIERVLDSPRENHMTIAVVGLNDRSRCRLGEIVLADRPEHSRHWAGMPLICHV